MKIINKILFLTVCASLFSCSKNNSIDPTVLTGKWKLTATMASPGPPVPWEPVLSSNYVQFDSYGKLGGTVYMAFSSYAIKDSVTLVFTTPTQSSQNFRYSLKNGILEIDGYCIEGCGNRFTKVSN